MIYVLDACALIAWLSDEPGAEVVDRAVRDINSQCLAHAINLCEVFYDAYRNAGEAQAQSLLSDLRAVGIIERSDFDSAFWQGVGRLKGDHRKVSLADCCAMTLTDRVGGSLLTSDHHEFDPLAALGICPITFIR
ncbi:MAG: PIN domain-containing protein [Blastocatellia bacterium]